MRPSGKIKILIPTMLLLLGIDIEALAGLFRLESETISSSRNGEDQTFELPVYEFLSTNYQSVSRDLEFNADLSVFGDAVRSRNSFKLHLLNLAYTIVPDRVNFSIGRSFDVQHSIRTNTIDAVGVDFYLFEKQLKAGVFTGKEQRLEFKQWTPIANLAGSYLSYTSSSFFPFFGKLKFQHREYDRSNANKENLVQLSMQKPFAGRLSPELLIDSEVNVGSSHLNRLETEFEVYPNYSTSLRTSLQTYELLPADGIEQPIFSIFSQGRIYEASIQGEHQFAPEWTGSLSVAYDNYVFQAPKRTDGFKVESDLNYQLEYAHFRASLYNLHSYGGEVYGGRLTLGQKISDRSQITEAVDFAYYNKITSSKRSALNSELGFESLLSNPLKFSIGGEFNSNNNLKYDIRGVIKLTYLLWTET
jgi:hypothetical protein